MPETTLTIKEAIKAKETILALLKVAYLYFRANLELLSTAGRVLEKNIQSFEGEKKKIVDKYAEEIPSHKFVPYNQYQEFKEKIINILFNMNINQKKEKLDKLFDEYEVASNFQGQKGISIENRKMFEEEMRGIEENFTFNVDLPEVDVSDTNLINIFLKFPPPMKESLKFLIPVTKSNIIIPNSKIQ